MYDHTFKYKQVQISRSDIRPHIKWAVSLVILHMVTSIFLGLCVGMYGLTYSLHHPEGIESRDKRIDSGRLSHTKWQIVPLPRSCCTKRPVSIGRAMCIYVYIYAMCIYVYIYEKRR